MTEGNRKGKPENALLFPSERGNFIPWRIKPKERSLLPLQASDQMPVHSSI